MSTYSACSPCRRRSSERRLLPDRNAGRGVDPGSGSRDRHSVPREYDSGLAAQCDRADLPQHLSAARTVCAFRVQLSHPGTEHRPSPPRAAIPLRFPPDRQGHYQHQTSDLVHKERRLGSGGRAFPMGPAESRYDFTADQGKMDCTRIITPHLINEASIGIFYSEELGPAESPLAYAAIQKQYDRFAALGACAPPSPARRTAL